MENIKNPIFYCVFGLISGGKSTTIENVSYYNFKGKKIVYIPEPVGEWETSGLLEMLYNALKEKQTNKDKELYEPLLFELTAYSSRLRVMKEIINKNSDADVFILDSSIKIDYEVYTKKFLDDGLITENQMKICDMNYHNLNNIMSIPNIFKYIFLDTSIENCLLRKEKRKRQSEETGVSKEYLTSLKVYFEKFIEKGDVFDRIIRIDGNDPQDKVIFNIAKIIEKDLSLFNR